jgi:hypothetical protein
MESTGHLAERSTAFEYRSRFLAAAGALECREPQASLNQGLQLSLHLLINRKTRFDDAVERCRPRSQFDRCDHRNNFGCVLDGPRVLVPAARTQRTREI